MGIRYNFLQDAVQKKAVIVGLHPSENMMADIMSNPMRKDRLKYFMDELGLLPIRGGNVQQG